MKIRSAAKTHIGLVRENNEDAYLCNDALGLYAVADGMGGHAAGEVASGIAISRLSEFSRFAEPGPVNLRSAFASVNRMITERACGPHAGMGTTLTALLIREGFPAYIGHVGDSRCYLVRDGVGRQLTQDHAVPGTSVLLNCLGSRLGSHIKTDIITEEARPGDVFILCSDGLSDYVDAEEAAQATDFGRRTDSGFFVSELASYLVGRALGLGGADNITVVVVAVEAD